MKKLTFLLLFVSSSLFAKNEIVRIENDTIKWPEIVAMESSKNYFLNIELSLIHPILGGFGGTVGIEKNHFSFGLMGFGTNLNHSTKHYIMENAEGLTVFNWGAELYSDYYIKKNHRGLFFGSLISLNGFIFNDIPDPQTIHAVYVVPRIGYRIYLPKKLNLFYFQPAVSFQVKIWDNADKFLYREIDMNSNFIISQLTLGMKL